MKSVNVGNVECWEGPWRGWAHRMSDMLCPPTEVCAKDSWPLSRESRGVRYLMGWGSHCCFPWQWGPPLCFGHNRIPTCQWCQRELRSHTSEKPAAHWTGKAQDSMRKNCTIERKVLSSISRHFLYLQLTLVMRKISQGICTSALPDPTLRLSTLPRRNWSQVGGSVSVVPEKQVDSCAVSHITDAQIFGDDTVIRAQGHFYP